MKKVFLLFFSFLFCISLFCQTNKKTFVELNQKQLVEIILDSKQLLDSDSSIQNANLVINKLSLLFDQIQSSTTQNMLDSSCALLIQAYLVLDDWDNIQKYFNLMTSPDEYCNYAYAFSLYKQKKLLQTEKFLATYIQNNKEDKDFLVLYANVLAKQKKYKEAKTIYEKLLQNNFLYAQDLYDYANTLYNLGDYPNAIKYAKESKNKDSYYLIGICFLSLENYLDAYNSFKTYNEITNKELNLSELSFFYQAFCAYKLKNYKESYALFSKLANSSKQVSLKKQAYELAARSSLLVGDYKNAAVQAENLIKFCVNQEEKEKAIIFCSEIYIDSNEYEKAINLLQPYSNKKNDFGTTCLLNMAQIYEKQNQTSKAEQTYIKILNEAKNNAHKKVALQKRAQLYYAQKKYKEAGQFFANFVTLYKDSDFYEEATYFASECFYYSKDFSECIKFSIKLINEFPKSVYFYGANKNLLLAYLENKDYTKAQETFNLLKKLYPKSKEVKSFEKLISQQMEKNNE